MTSETTTDHETGLAELIRLAYETRLSDWDRLEALFVIVESGPPHERRHAAQRLTQYVETVHDLAVRMRALDMLRQAGEASGAADALLRRALDMRRPLPQRTEAATLLWYYLPERDEIPAPHESWEPSFEDRTFRAPTMFHEPGDYGATVMVATLGITKLGPLQAAKATGRFARTRPIDWGTRASLVKWLSPRRFSSSSASPPLEPIFWEAATILAGDSEVPLRQRLALLTGYAHRVPSRSADVVALLSSWMRDRTRSRAERRAVLSVLLSEISTDEVLALAADDRLPVHLRSVAAVAYGVAARRAPEARRMLTELAGAPGTGPFERLGCLIRRAVLPLVIRLER